MFFVCCFLFCLCEFCFVFFYVFFLIIRRPPRSTLDRSSAASDVYKRQGVKYVVGGKKEPPGDTTFLIPVHDADPNVTIYLNTLALPRAMVLFNSEVVADHDAAFAATHDATFDPARVVILESGRALRQEPGQATIEVVR